MLWWRRGTIRQFRLAQAAGLQATLGDEFRVAAGMRFSSPSIEDAGRDLREQGVERVLGLILSPQYSPILMHGYVQAIECQAALSKPGT